MIPWHQHCPLSLHHIIHPPTIHNPGIITPCNDVNLLNQTPFTLSGAVCRLPAQIHFVVKAVYLFSEDMALNLILKSV